MLYVRRARSRTMAERPKSGSGLSAKEQFELRKKEKAVEDAKNAEAQKAKDDAHPAV